MDGIAMEDITKNLNQLISDEKRSFYKGLGGLEYENISRLVTKKTDAISLQIGIHIGLRFGGGIHKFGSRNILVADENYNFRLLGRVLYFLLSISLIIAISIAIYDSKINEATVTANLIHALSVIGDTHNTQMLFSVGLLELIIWNNTTTMFGKPVFTVLKERLNYFQDVAIPAMSAINELDLGEFSEYYKNITSEKFKLGTWFSQTFDGSFKNCGIGATAFADNNLISFLMITTSIIDEILQLWEMKQDNPTGLKDLIYNEKLIGYLAYTDAGMFSQIFYRLMIPIQQVLEEIIIDKPSNSRLVDRSVVRTVKKDERYLYKIIPGYIVVIILLYYSFVGPLHKIFRYYWNTIRLLSLRLIESNPKLNIFFGKVYKENLQFVHF